MACLTVGLGTEAVRQAHQGWMDAQHLLDLRLKRLVSEYRFMECQLEEMTFAMDSFASKFREEFQTDIALAASRKLCVINLKEEFDGQDTDAETDCSKGHISSCSLDEPSRLARRLYKRLALILHPDKPSGSAPAFQAVEEAYRGQDSLKLVMLAHEAGIPVEGMFTEFDDVSSSITCIREKINKIKASVAWAWYDAEESTRPQLRRAIVETLGRCR